MADNNPGQVISPNSDSNEPSASVPRQNQEVSVPLNGRQQPAASPAIQQPSPPNAGQSTVSAQPPQQPAVQQVLPPQIEQPTEPQPMQQTESGYDETAVSSYPLPEDDTEQEQHQGDDAVTWTASEYVAHHKSISWYVVLAVGTIGVAGLVYWITGGDIISTAVIVVVAIVFGMYAGRKSRVQEYGVSATGVNIGQKTYPYRDLKSFSVIDEGPFSSISFMPLKRFMPVISIYYDPADEQHIVDVLAAHLPMEQRGHDAIDRLMKKIRF